MAITTLGLGIWFGLTFSSEMVDRGCYPISKERETIRVTPKHPGRIRFLAMGDTGTGQAAQRIVAQAAKRVCAEEDCDFVLLLGDNFYPDGLRSLSDSRFEEVFTSQYKEFQIPFFPVLGNHDVRNPPVYEIMKTDSHPLWKMPDFEYEIRTRDARILAVNTNCSTQVWANLVSRLQSSFGGWTFVFGHHSIYSAGPHGNTNRLIRTLWEWILAERVDFYLSGHNHVLELKRGSDGQTDYIVSGAGAMPPAPDIPENWTPLPEIFQPPYFIHRAGGFCLFEVTRSAVWVRFYDASGQVLYQYRREKPKGA